MENSMVLASKTKKRTTIWPSNTTPGIYPEKTIIQKVSCTTMFIAALFTIARTWKQCKCTSTDEWIKKMWHIYTMEYYSTIKGNEIELFVVRWMDLESVIQSEVSQKEKNKYRMLTHIYGIWKKKKKKKWSWRTLGQDRNKDTDLPENVLEDTGKGKGKLWQSERVSWTYIHYKT